MSHRVKQVWPVMLINFCLLHLQCLGSLRWLGSTASSERATSSLSGTGGNSLHTSNWTKCLSNSQTSYVHEIIIQTRSQQRFLSCKVFFFWVRFPNFFCVTLHLPAGLVGQGHNEGPVKDWWPVRSVKQSPDHLATARSRVRGCGLTRREAGRL